ncbi:uncharacterized protein LOC127725374 [Mytilus californianus]|uniref:uncharacterized protein LOC127725374 n=1 Tax=Mytilus californianus TaxID=6549 RepID=UPI002245F834|nr:uncharacterized protein LOC127725374 [Mytilus californianus]
MDSVEGANAQQEVANAESADDTGNFQAISHDNKENPVKNIKLGKSMKVLCDDGSNLPDVPMDEYACLPGAGGIGTSIGNDNKLDSTAKHSKTETAKSLKAGSDKAESLNVYQSISINIKNKIPKEVDAILQLVCACLNSKKPISLKLENKHFSTAKTKDFDEWYDRLEKKMKSYFLDTPTDLIQLSRSSNCNSTYISLQIRPAKLLCSLDTHLYFPSVSSVDQVKNEKAFEIITQDKHFGELSFDHDKTFVLNRTVKGLRREDVDIQFKEITGKNIPRTLVDMASKYISAFANHKGGSIYFGIEDKHALVVGVDISNTDESTIANSLEERINKMQWLNSPLSMEKGKHWDIWFEEIDEMSAVSQGKRLRVIIVSVAEMPGGVFTTVPESFYTDNNGNVLQYTNITQWKHDFIKLYKECPATKADLQQISEKLDAIHKEKGERTFSFNDKQEKKTVAKVTNITERQLVQNPIFTKKNYELLTEFMTSKKCVVLKGIIGSGKSELALRYCYNASKTENVVDTWNFKSTDKSSLEKSLRDICPYLNIHDIPPKQDEEFQDEVIDELFAVIVETVKNDRHDRSHIFLFDDVKDITRDILDDIFQKCIRTFNIKCIITTVLAFEPDDDVRIIDIKGFTEEEALDFIREGKTLTPDEKEGSCILSRKLSCNPKALQIVRTYMKYARLKIGGIIERLKLPSDILKVEESRAVKSKVKDKMFSLLISILREIHQKYQEDKKEEIFEMFLMLQYMQVEKIPVTIFSNINVKNSRMDTDDLLYVVENCSFGTVEGEDDGMYDYRLLSTHDVVVFALEIYCEYKGTNIHRSKEDLLQKLLGSFFLLMDKDNVSRSSLQHHTLLLPHTRSVINHLNEYVYAKIASSTSNWCITNTELVLKMIYMNDLVGFTSGFIETCTSSNKYFEMAKYLLFQMLCIDEDTFDEEINQSCENITDIEAMKKIAEQYSLHICKAIVSFIQSTDQIDVVEKVAKQFLLYKNRNMADVELLRSKLGKRNLETGPKLSEDEYKKLCEEGFAIPEDYLGPIFVYEIVTSVLYTCGRRMFYLPGSSKHKEARYFCVYLYIAHLLPTYLCYNKAGEMTNLLIKKSSELPQVMGEQNINDDFVANTIRHPADTYSDLKTFNILSTMLTERSVIQSTMDPTLAFNEPSSEVLKKNLAICEARFYEKKHYMEFGILKMSTEENDYNRMLWLKQITRIYRLLLKKNKEFSSVGLKWAESLSAEIQKMKTSTAYPSLMISLGDLYLALGEISTAECCFREFIPKLEDKGNKKPDLNKYQRRACINYIKCRIQNYNDKNNDLETLSKLLAFKLGLTCHTRELLEMGKLESKLNQKLEKYEDI